MLMVLIKKRVFGPAYHKFASILPITEVNSDIIDKILQKGRDRV